MSISSVTPFLGAVQAAGLTPSTRQKEPTFDPMATTMAEIREKGLGVWAHEKRMEALKEKLRAEVLSDRKMTEEDLAAMPSELRSSIEAEIQKIVEQKLMEAMQKAVEEAAETGKTEAVLVDIVV